MIHSTSVRFKLGDFVMAEATLLAMIADFKAIPTPPPTLRDLSHKALAKVGYAPTRRSASRRTSTPSSPKCRARR